MGTQNVVERILSDARNEARSIMEEAENKAAKTLADASLRAEKLRGQAERDVATKRESILEKRAADARLDSAKHLLKEKRKVMDAIYDEALSRLLELSKEESLRLVASLLEAYAEEGDEIYFAKNFRYENEVEILPIVLEKKLCISSEKLLIDGGFVLKGKICDKDLSFKALLAADKDEYQAELARKIFK